MMLYYLMDEPEKALDMANRIRPMRGNMNGLLITADYTLLHSLAICAAFGRLSPAKRFRCRLQLARNERQLRKWASSCEANAVPVDNEKQIHKAFAHPEISNIDSPDLIRPIDCQAAKQVGPCVGGMKALAQVWLRIDRFEPHDLHQSAHALTVDHKALIAKDSRHAPITVVGMFHVDLIDPVHELDIPFALTLLFARTVDTRPIHTEQFCLALDRDIRVIPFHHRFSCLKRFI